MTTIALLPGDGIGSEILDGPIAFLRQLERDGAPVSVTGPWPYGSSGWAADRLDPARADRRGLPRGRRHPFRRRRHPPRHHRAAVPQPGGRAHRAAAHLRPAHQRAHGPRARRGRRRSSSATSPAAPTPARPCRVESDGTRPAEDRARARARARAGGLRHRRRARAQHTRTGVRISVDKASVYATSPTVATHRTRNRRRQPASAFADVNVDRAAYELVKYDAAARRSSSPKGCSATSCPTSCARAPVHRRSAVRRRSTRTGRFGNGTTALFEPAHGSSPHRTGSRRSNPTGAWLALADLFAWCPDLAALGSAHRAFAARSTTSSTPRHRPTTSPRPASRRSIWTSSTSGSSTRWRA